MTFCKVPVSRHHGLGPDGSPRARERGSSLRALQLPASAAPRDSALAGNCRARETTAARAVTRAAGTGSAEALALLAGDGRGIPCHRLGRQAHRTRVRVT